MALFEGICFPLETAQQFDPMRNFLFQRRAYFCAILLLAYGVCHWLGLRIYGNYLFSIGLMFLHWLGRKFPEQDEKKPVGFHKCLAIVGAVIVIIGGLIMIGNQFYGNPSYFAPRTVSFLILLLATWIGCCLFIGAYQISQRERGGK